jgi:hypothetical protein
MEVVAQQKNVTTQAQSQTGLIITGSESESASDISGKESNHQCSSVGCSAGTSSARA